MREGRQLLSCHLLHSCFSDPKLCTEEPMFPLQPGLHGEQGDGDGVDARLSGTLEPSGPLLWAAFQLCPGPSGHRDCE